MSTAAIRNTIRQNWAIVAIEVLLRNKVLTTEKVQEEVNILRNHGGFGVYATISGNEYNISGMAVGPYIIQIEDELTGDSIYMETIKKFEEWVKTRLTAQDPEVSASAVADP